MGCENCKYYRERRVPDLLYGIMVTEKVCTATENDTCPVEESRHDLAVPCPICGREMREIDDMCDVCLKYEMAAQNDAANERRHISEILEVS